MDILSVPQKLSSESSDHSNLVFQAYEKGRQGEPLPNHLIINEHLLDSIPIHQEGIAELDQKRRQLKGGLTGTDRGQVTAVIASILAIGAQILSGAGDVVDEIAGARRNKIFGISALAISVLAFGVWFGSVVLWYRYSSAQQAKAQLGPVSPERVEDRRKYHAFLTAVRNFLDKSKKETTEQTRHRLKVVMVRYHQLPPTIRETIPPIEYWTGRLLEALPVDHEFIQQLHQACLFTLPPDSPVQASMAGELNASMNWQEPSFEHACYYNPLQKTESLDNAQEGLASLHEFKRLEDLTGCSIPKITIGNRQFSRWATVDPAPPLVDIEIVTV